MAVKGAVLGVWTGPTTLSAGLGSQWKKAALELPLSRNAPELKAVPFGSTPVTVSFLDAVEILLRP
jgi:hypothetical protein